MRCSVQKYLHIYESSCFYFHAKVRLLNYFRIETESRCLIFQLKFWIFFSSVCHYSTFKRTQYLKKNRELTQWYKTSSLATFFLFLSLPFSLILSLLVSFSTFFFSRIRSPSNRSAYISLHVYLCIYFPCLSLHVSTYSIYLRGLSPQHSNFPHISFTNSFSLSGLINHPSQLL